MAEIQEFIPSEVYYSKVKKKEKVEIDNGALELKMSKFEIVLGIIMRLCSRWTKQEISVLEQDYNVPVLVGNDEGYKGRYRSISQMQKLLKTWRNNREKGISNEEIDKLCYISESLKRDPQSVNNEALGFEHVNINLSESHLYDLPVISGCIATQNNSFLGVSCTIDSGASTSACGEQLLKSLGKEVTDLIPCPQLRVNTANSPCQPLGILKTKIYLRWRNKQFFYINCEILVLSSALNKLLIGIRDLYKANFSLDKDKITLDCFSTGGIQKRRIFNTKKSEEEKRIPLTPKVNEEGNTSFSFDSVHHLEMTNKNWNLIIKKKSKRGQKLNEVKIPVKEEIKIKNMTSKITTKEGEIEELNFLGNVETNMNLNKTWEDSIFFLEEREDGGNIEKNIIEDISQAVEDFQCMLAESKNGNYKEMREAEEEIESVESEAEEQLLSKMSLFPDEAPEDDPEYFIPDLSSLNEEYQDKFRKLFSNYKQNFSKNKWDICISTLPEVNIPTKPGEVACSESRRYMNEELEIIDQYLEELEKKNLIRELNHNEFSPWNHCIHLVFRQSGGARQFCQSIADKKSTEERLKMLRSSSRAVADVVNLNKITLSHGPVYLPMVGEILPYMGGRLACLTDIRSGFSTIPLNYESQLKTAFTHRNKRFIHRCLIQGSSISPLIYSLRMEIVFNNESFKLFLEKNAPNSNINYNTSFFRYLDDVLMLADNVEDMLLLWKYTMEQLAKYRIKITKSKTSICKPKFTFLGWDFAPLKNTYMLETQRRSAISKWEFKGERSYLVSRLATLQWNSNLIFGFKYLSQLLSSLVLQKQMRVRKCHVREWILLIFSSSWVMNIYIPDLSENLYCCCDSSFSALGAFLFQYSPKKKYTTPEGIVWDNKDEGEGVIKDKEGEEVVLSRLEVVGMYSKRWGKDSVQKSIIYKEILALMWTLKEYDCLLRSCTAKTLIWSDASCLSMLHRMKSINSKIYNIALILSSYPRMSIYFSKGGYMTFTCDLLSRVLENNDITFDGGIDQKYLEILPEQSVGNIVINAKAIHHICMSPLSPEFSALALRRKQPYERVMSEEKMLKLLDSSQYPEESVLNAIMYGRDSIKPNNVIFTDKNNKNIISMTDFNNLSRKMNFAAVKAEIMFLAEHSFHQDDEQEWEGLCRTFLLNLKTFMEQNTEIKEPSLWDKINSALRQPSCSERDLYLILHAFQQSSIYNTESEFNDLSPCLFIPTFQDARSEVIIEYNEGKYLLRAKYNREVKEGEPVVYNVHIHFTSKYFFSVHSEVQGLFYPILHERGQIKSLEYLVLGCNPGNDYTIERNQVLCKFQFHFGNDRCSCVSPKKMHLVLEKCDEITDEQNVQILMSELLFLDLQNLNVCVNCQDHICKCVSRDILLSEILNPTVTQHLELGEPGPADEIKTDNKNISYLNQLICLALSFNKKNVFSPKFVQSLQSSSEYLIKVREDIKQGKTDKYFMYKNCVFYKDKQNNRKLCVDDSTCLLLFNSLHQRHIHHSLELILHHFRSYFHNINDKKWATQSVKSCSICLFGESCLKTNFIKNYHNEEVCKVWQSLHVDLCESIVKSNAGYFHFVIVCDRASGKVLGCPLKTTQSEEILEFFHNLIRYIGIFQNLFSDFGAAFTSNKFQAFLDRYKINHFRSAKRSVSNGLIEERIRRTRNQLRDLILQDSLQRRLNWQDYFTECILIVNSSPLYKKFNNFSRDRLFFGGSRWLYNVAWNTECSVTMSDLEQQQMLKRIHDFRLDYRAKFNDLNNPFVINQLCKFVKSKEEMKDDGNGRGRQLQPTCGTIFRIIGLNEVACRCLDLVTGDQISIEWGRLKPLDLVEIKSIFNSPIYGRKSTFRDNMYKQGYGKTVLEFIEDLVDNERASIVSRTRGDGESQSTNESSGERSEEFQSTNESSERNEPELPGTNEEADQSLHPPILTNDSQAQGEPRPQTSNEIPPPDPPTLSNSEKLKIIASHPYPCDFIDQYTGENKNYLIKRAPDRNSRYPARSRKIPNKFRNSVLVVEHPKVHFCPDVRTREHHLDNEGDLIFDKDRKQFKHSDSVRQDFRPDRKSTSSRGSFKVEKDLSTYEVFNLNWRV